MSAYQLEGTLSCPSEDTWSSLVTVEAIVSLQPAQVSRFMHFMTEGVVV